MRLLLGSLTRQSLQQTTVLLWILWTIRPHNQMLLQGCCFRSLEALLGILWQNKLGSFAIQSHIYFIIVVSWSLFLQEPLWWCRETFYHFETITCAWHLDVCTISLMWSISFQYEAYSIERNAERVQESAKLFYIMWVCWF